MIGSQNLDPIQPMEESPSIPSQVPETRNKPCRCFMSKRDYDPGLYGVNLTFKVDSARFEFIGAYD
jgi:hypothetical protein